MNCADARERLVDRLLDDLTAEQAGLLEQHLAGCPACRADAASMESTWELLGADPDERSEPAGRERLESAARGVLAGAPRKRMRWPLRVAAALAWLSIGFMAGFGMGGGSGADATLGDDTYIILVHETESVLEQIPRDEMRAAGVAYREWVKRHRESGELIEAAWLPTENAFWIDGRNGDVEERQFYTGNREITYYWLVRAESGERALDIARTCPFLRIGARLELRRVADPDGGRS